MEKEEERLKQEVEQYLKKKRRNWTDWKMSASGPNPGAMNCQNTSATP